MHPYQHIFLHRGPSRIFWFILGAGAATWFHHCSTHNPCLISHRRALESAPWHDRTSIQQRDLEWNKERIKHLQQRAEGTVADLSETTLDSIISGAESLKAKLTQLRTEREQLEAEKKVAQSSV